jgi:hypothetical protein
MKTFSTRTVLTTSGIAAIAFAAVSVAAPHLAHAGYVVCNAWGCG